MTALAVAWLTFVVCIGISQIRSDIRKAAETIAKAIREKGGEG